MRIGFSALLLTALLPVVQSCAVWAPGKDPAGQAYIASANKVLFAIQAYHAAEGRLPSSLTELVPKYIPSLPDKPDIWIAKATGELSFHYSPTLGWGQCICVATPTASSFGCGLCYW